VRTNCDMRPFPALFLMALLAAFPLAAANDADLFASAKTALENDQHAKAAELLEQAIKLNPKKVEYHIALAEAYGEQAMSAGMFKAMGLAKKSKAALERAVALDPRSIEARNGLIQFHLMAPGVVGGDKQKAVEHANEIRKIDPLQGRRAFVRIYMAQKQPELARKEAVEAVREAPNSAAAHFLLGNVYFTEKNWTAALHEYEYALKVDPSFMPAKFRIGVVAADSKTNQARGEEMLKSYVAYKPKSGEPVLGSAWYYLGKLYEGMGRKADAKQAYLSAQKLAPKAKEIAEALKRVSS
jgi:tetratricopeptide (TPR) repeat protein